MDKSDIQKVVDFIETTWRSRTPATRIDSVNASYRVGRGEVRLWCNNNNIKLNELDTDFNNACLKMFKKLKKEFPNDMWQ